MADPRDNITAFREWEEFTEHYKDLALVAARLANRREIRASSVSYVRDPSSDADGIISFFAYDYNDDWTRLSVPADVFFGDPNAVAEYEAETERIRDEQADRERTRVNDRERSLYEMLKAKYEF